MKSPHLPPEFYLTHTQLVERALLPVVIRQREQGVIAMITYERNLL